MLGVRHYRGCAVDLWCGDSDEFVVDTQLPHWEMSDTYAGKHIGVLVADTKDPDALFKQLKQDLDDAKQIPRRISIITPELQVYKQLQDALFTCFPEGADD